MQNDKTYYKRLEGNQIDYPEEVFPFDYHNIKLFTSKNDDGWHVTEAKTGFRLGDTCETQEEAENSARSVIDTHGINPTKHAIKEAALQIKKGFKYESGSKRWVWSEQ